MGFSWPSLACFLPTCWVLCCLPAGNPIDLARCIMHFGVICKHAHQCVYFFGEVIYIDDKKQWGTPERASAHNETTPFTATSSLLPVTKNCIQFTISPFMQYPSNFLIKRLCATLSKAFGKSKYTISKYLPFSMISTSQCILSVVFYRIFLQQIHVYWKWGIHCSLNVSSPGPWLSSMWLCRLHSSSSRGGNFWLLISLLSCKLVLPWHISILVGVHFSPVFCS